MSKIEARLQDMGITLPEPLVLPGPTRTSGVLVDKMLYVSGHGAALLEEDNVKRRGNAGLESTEDEGNATAPALAIKMIETVKHHVGD